MTTNAYTFTARWHAERDRLASLEGLWDPATQRALEAVGVGAGWSCLDVGAGSGSVARLLAGHVGEHGRVVALDHDVRFLDPAQLPGTVEIREHDLLSEEPVPGSFDLVHARMVLTHLPQRDEVVDRLVRLCKPGGTVLLSDFDTPGETLSAQSPPADDATRFLRLHDAVVAVLAANGYEPRYGYRLPSVLAAAGLVGVDAVIDGGLVRGGRPAAEFYRHTFQRLREPILAGTPVTEDLVERVLDRLHDPEFVTLSSPLVSAWGRRPVEN